MARRGAHELGQPNPEFGTASAAWRRAVERARGDGNDDFEHTPAAAPEPWEPEVWLEEPDDEPAAAPRTRARRTAPLPDAKVDPATGRVRPRRRLPPAVRDELASNVGANAAGKFTDRLADATRAYERDRYQDAQRILRSLADLAPRAAAVRELLGLTLYRMGKYQSAAKELELFVEMTGSTDQHPTLADSYRALGRHKKVPALWDELRQASPGAEVVTEGRIVMAESLADQGDVAGAIKLLEKGGVERKRPREHHLRQWYALADLYERAGDIPRARQLFRRIAEAGPETFEVEERVRALR